MKEFRGKFVGGALDGEIILENDDDSFSSDVAAVVIRCGRENGVGGTFFCLRSHYRITRWEETPQEIIVEAEFFEPG